MSCTIRILENDMRSPGWLERVLIAIGCGCLTATGIDFVEAASFQQTAAASFERALIADAPSQPTSDVAGLVAPVDDGLIGRLEIPRLNLSVMVMEGDDAATLARSVGHLRETPLPWESGNAVLAGHRDTLFRPLKDLREGDEIRITTTRGTFDYRVTATLVVDPDDLSVLAPTPDRSLTLVTCYPFYYLGHAPQRFIVHAQ